MYVLETGSICSCISVSSHQWTGPGVREAAQSVPAHIEDTQGFQTVHDGWRQTAQAVIRHIQLLQLTEANPVGVWESGRKENKDAN